jgi:hypothetical protein
MSTNATTNPAPAPDRDAPEESGDKGTDRRAVAIAGAVLLACGGLAAYGILGSQGQPRPHAVPTAEVTYQVLGHGTADISYLGHNEKGKATVITGAELPWHKTVDVPLGKEPVVNIVLDDKGGQASCTLAVRGVHVQRSTASGPYGRATCHGGTVSAKK